MNRFAKAAVAAGVAVGMLLSVSVPVAAAEGTDGRSSIGTSETRGPVSKRPSLGSASSPVQSAGQPGGRVVKSPSEKVATRNPGPRMSPREAKQQLREQRRAQAREQGQALIGQLRDFLRLP